MALAGGTMACATDVETICKKHRYVLEGRDRICFEGKPCFWQKTFDEAPSEVMITLCNRAVWFERRAEKKDMRMAKKSA